MNASRSRHRATCRFSAGTNVVNNAENARSGTRLPGVRSGVVNTQVARVGQGAPALAQHRLACGAGYSRTALHTSTGDPRDYSVKCHAGPVALGVTTLDCNERNLQHVTLLG